jgi:hypothetical protein
MMLGDLMARLEDEAVAEEMLLATADLALIGRVRSLAGEDGTSVGACLSRLIGRFLDCADADAWMAVMSAAGRSDDPGAACLSRMVQSALRMEDAVP